MNSSRKASIIINDLDSMIHRIEDLPANESYTDAQIYIEKAINCVKDGQVIEHQKDMKIRFNTHEIRTQK